jgi:hypothetical protein
MAVPVAAGHPLELCLNGSLQIGSVLLTADQSLEGWLLALLSKSFNQLPTLPVFGVPGNVPSLFSATRQCQLPDHRGF